MALKGAWDSRQGLYGLLPRALLKYSSWGLSQIELGLNVNRPRQSGEDVKPPAEAEVYPRPSALAHPRCPQELVRRQLHHRWQYSGRLFPKRRELRKGVRQRVRRGCG